MRVFRLLIVASISVLTAFSSAAETGNPNAAEGLIRIPDLLPTVYNIADEETVSCKGWYGRGSSRKNYKGTEREKVLTPEGTEIATVCGRYYAVLAMEGTGLLKDRGDGRHVINWAGSYRYRIMDRCIHGEGVENLCLLPFHTIAADLKKHQPGKVIFIARAKGLRLPDGRPHSGYFMVRDTGGAFVDIGPKRVDLFIFNQSIENNIFGNAGFTHTRPEEAYEVVGEKRLEALRTFEELFGDLL